MELSQLRTLICVAELGSLSKAGDRLRIAQPALSRQVRMLEEELGVALFTRHGRGMVLTERGREVLKQAGALVAVAALILITSYVAFARLLVVPPLVPCLVAYGCAGILTLLRRSLVASARLDRNISELALSGDLLAPAGPGIPGAYQWAEGGPVSLSRGWLPKQPPSSMPPTTAVPSTTLRCAAR